MANLSFVTFNLHSRYDRWFDRRALIVEQLVALQPDLIALQEVYLPNRQGEWLKQSLNNRLTGRTNSPYQLLQAPKQHWFYRFWEAVGVLSRLPVVAADRFALGYRGQVALRVNVEMPAGLTVDFVTVHLQSPSHEQQTRLDQVIRLLGWLNDRNPLAHQIVAGSFGETPDGPAIQQMKQVYRSAYQVGQGYEPLATFPTVLAQQSDGWSGCLDYLFISAAIKKVSQAKICCDLPASSDDTLYPSDHVGLFAGVEILPKN